MPRRPMRRAPAFYQGRAAASPELHHGAWHERERAAKAYVEEALKNVAGPLTTTAFLAVGHKPAA